MIREWRPAHSTLQSCCLKPLRLFETAPAAWNRWNHLLKQQKKPQARKPLPPRANSLREPAQPSASWRQWQTQGISEGAPIEPLSPAPVEYSQVPPSPWLMNPVLESRLVGRVAHEVDARTACASGAGAIKSKNIASAARDAECRVRSCRDRRCRGAR